MNEIRQGDVMLIPLEGIKPPKGARLEKRVILAEGEETGHSHKLLSENGVLVWDDMVWVVGPEPGALSHEDHDPEPAQVVLAETPYRVVRQREETLSGQWRPVED